MSVNKKVEILYLQQGPGFGGAVVSLCELLDALDRKKFHPIVLVSHKDVTTREWLIKSGVFYYYAQEYKRPLWVKKTLERLNNVRGFKKMFLICVLFIEFFLRIPFFLKVLKIAVENKIDLIHLNNGIQIEGIIAAKLLRIPCISHNRDAMEKSLFSKWFVRYGGIRCFVAISEFVRRSLLKSGVPSTRTRLVYNGVDVEKCREKSESNINIINKYSYGKYNIGLFGCLVDWKGHKVFIKAIDILIRKEGMKECKFFIVGDTPNKNSHLKKELISLVDKLNLSDYVIFTGYQSNVYPLMKKMDIVVHASVRPEPFGRVIIEAMALGKPVIATDMGGPKEIIQNGINGILISPNDPFNLAEVIVELLKNKEKMNYISENAVKTVEKKFTLEKHVREIEKIYEALIK